MSDRLHHPSSRTRTAAVAVFLLLVTGFSLASPALTPISEGARASDLLGHGAPCPDSERDGHPCEGGCCWLCCPRHAKACVPIFVSLVKELAVSSDALAPPSDSHPAEVVWRVFHPPRA